MIIKAKRLIKDHWSDWPDAYCIAPSFDRDGYQKKLNEIAGFSREKPILRLVWGGEEKMQRYTEWDMWGNPLKERIEPRYKLRKLGVFDSVVLIPFRRWIIEELCEPEQYEPDKHDDISFTNEYGYKCPSAKKPKEFYTPLIFVGNHKNCPSDCCKDRICPGDMKNPDEAELYWVAEQTIKLLDERIGDPRKILGPDELAKISKEVSSLKKPTASLGERLGEISL